MTSCWRLVVGANVIRALTGILWWWMEFIVMVERSGRAIAAGRGASGRCRVNATGYLGGFRSHATRSFNW